MRSETTESSAQSPARPAEHCFPAGVVAAVLLGSLVKAAYLGCAISPACVRPATLIMLPDLSVVAIVTLLAVATPRLRAVRALQGVAIATIVLLFAIDAGVAITLFDRLHLDDLARYGREARKVIAVAGAERILFCIIALLLLIRVRVRLSPARRRKVLFFAVGLYALSWYPADYPFTMRKMCASVLSVLLEPLSDSITKSYPPEEAEAAAKSLLDDRRFRPPPGRPNLIVVMIESLSSFASNALGGLGDQTPALDALFREGTVFDNFIANDTNTEGGLVALLNAMPALPIIGGGAFPFADYGSQPSAIPYVHQHGYDSYFLTSGPLRFLHKGKYLTDLGFQHVEGQNEVPRFKSGKRYSFDSVADGVLYEEALARIPALADAPRRFFLVLLTVSGHAPYIDPRTGKGSLRGIFDYETQELAKFHSKLTELGFYNNGVLIVLGDHRAMIPVPDSQWSRWGDSAVARVPLLLIGKGVRKGAIDHRFLQQSDLLRLLPSVISGEGDLSGFAVFPERGSRYGRSAHVRLAVFDSSDGGRNAGLIGLRGADLEVIGRSTATLPRAVEAVHRQRAGQQWLFRTAPRSCRFDAPRVPPASGKSGVRVDVYSGTDLNGALERSSPRYLRSADVETPTLADAAPHVPNENFALEFTTYFKAEETGLYRFQFASDDGICAALDGALIIDGNKDQASTRYEVEVALDAGLHPLVVRYYQARFGKNLAFRWYRGMDHEEPFKESFSAKDDNKDVYVDVTPDLFILPQEGR